MKHLIRPLFIALCPLALLAAAPAQAKQFEVTRTNDPNPGACMPKDCSLREAVLAADKTAAADTIVLGAATYKLTRAGFGEDAGQTGDLDVSAETNLRGAGAGKTAIQGAFPTDDGDRLMDVLPGAKLSIRGLTLRDGGRGVYEASGIEVGFPDPDPGVLSLRNVDVKSMNTGYAEENYGRATLKHVRFIKNSAGEGCCAAFYNESGSTVKMSDVSFEHNRAGEDTGAMYSEGDSAVLRNVTFANNHAGNVGGAFIPSGGTQVLENVTFVGNRDTGDGGAMQIEANDSVLMNNVTFTRNVADSDGDDNGDGGGIYVANVSTPVTLQNTILAGNEDASPTANVYPDCRGTIGSNGFNLLGIDEGCTFTATTGDHVGTTAAPVIPKLGVLSQSGGFVPTVPLRKGSPAINHGSTKTPGSGGSACAKKDARHVKRPQGPRCDIGAYELKK